MEQTQIDQWRKMAKRWSCYDDNITNDCADWLLEALTEIETLQKSVEAYRAAMRNVLQHTALFGVYDGAKLSEALWQMQEMLPLTDSGVKRVVAAIQHDELDEALSGEKPCK